MSENESVAGHETRRQSDFAADHDTRPKPLLQQFVTNKISLRAQERQDAGDSMSLCSAQQPLSD